MLVERKGSLPVARTWFERQAVADGITLIRESHVAAWLRCNIWHVRGRDRDLLIDSGMGMRPLKAEIALLAERPVIAVASHAHFDHIGGAWEFAVRLGHGSEAAIHAGPGLDNTCAKAWLTAEVLTALPGPGYDLSAFAIRPAPLTGHLDEGDVVDLGDRVFHVYHLPGHSPGSIALYEPATGTLFSGDVVYDGELIDNAYHSDPAAYRDSLARLRELPVSVVHAGHFGSFGRQRMLDIIDEYMAGGRRLGRVEDWLAGRSV